MHSDLKTLRDFRGGGIVGGGWGVGGWGIEKRILLTITCANYEVY